MRSSVSSEAYLEAYALARESEAPDPAYYLFRAAQNFHRGRDMARARALLDQLIAEHPGSPNATVAEEMLKTIPK